MMILQSEIPCSSKRESHTHTLRKALLTSCHVTALFAPHADTGQALLVSFWGLYTPEEARRSGFGLGPSPVLWPQEALLSSHVGLLDGPAERREQPAWWLGPGPLQCVHCSWHPSPGSASDFLSFLEWTYISETVILEAQIR